MSPSILGRAIDMIGVLGLTNVDNRIGVCGLYCASCGAWRRCHDGEESFTGGPDARPGERLCKGCLSDLRSKWCTTCDIRDCAAEKGIGTCAECPEMPCDRLLAFEKSALHHEGVIEQLRRLGSLGQPAWIKAQRKRWSCTGCGVPYDWHTKLCVQCGKAVDGFDEEYDV